MAKLGYLKNWSIHIWNLDVVERRYDVVVTKLIKVVIQIQYVECHFLYELEIFGTLTAFGSSILCRSVANMGLI